MSTEIFSAIQRYCQYQERCHMEVRNKLYELGCRPDEVEQHISNLIEKNVLNEERYARAIARGKFTQKHWGKRKIIQQLKFHKVSDYCIKKALTEIDPGEYEAVLSKLVEKKWHEIVGERNTAIRKNKVYRFLMQRGFESDLVLDKIHEIIKHDG